MIGLPKSTKTALGKILKKYRIEFFLIAISLGTLLFSYLYLLGAPSDKIEFNEDSQIKSSQKIYVEVAGSVNKPGVYALNYGSRLKDALNAASGLSEAADKDFFSRNFNLARIIEDQEKIYVPHLWETQAGIFKENERTIDYTTSSKASVPLSVNINDAEIEELDQLPGIGKKTAEKIIENRPYSSAEELAIKKIVNKKVFEQIKDLIGI